MNIDILDILKPFGFDSSLPTRLVRHDRDQPEFQRQELLEIYQAYQKKPVYRDAEKIVSFVKMPGTHARFRGVFAVRKMQAKSAGPRPQNDEWPARWRSKAKYFYTLERDTRFDSLIGRLTIDWGLGRQWVQHLRKAPVIEVFAPGRALAPFRDYTEFSLTYRELKLLISFPEAHRDWHNALRAVAGVYLILDERSGEQYIGSAYGADGFWGRWRSYAKNGHGGNKLLKELIKKQKSYYPEKLRFSILQVMSKTMEWSEVTASESLFKHKLGCRVHGLNAN
jgi:hypothetical protein